MQKLSLSVYNTQTNQPELFLTTDTTQNNTTLSFSLTQANTSVTFQAGTSTIQVQPPADLFTADQLAAVNVADTSAWTLTYTTVSSQPTWTLTPKSDIILSQGTLNIELVDIAVTNQNLLGQMTTWTILWNTVEGTSNGYSLVSIAINAYTPDLQPLSLSMGWDGIPAVEVGDTPPYIGVSALAGFPQSAGTVYVTPPDTNTLYTGFAFYLTNTQTAISFTNDSVFTLSFVQPQGNDTAGALAQTTDIQNIRVAQYTVPGVAVWASIQQIKVGPTITWQMKPGTITMDTNQNATYVFQVYRIFSNLDPYPTRMYLQYQNIPGYLDGVYSLTVQLATPPTAVATLSVNDTNMITGPQYYARTTPANILDVGLNQAVTLGWSTIAATEVALDPNGAATIPDQPLSGTYANYVPYPTTSASGQISLATTPSVYKNNVWNFQLKPALITSFTANGQTTLHLTGPGQVTLAWQTQFAGGMTITDGLGQVIVSYQGDTDPGMVDSGSTVVNADAGTYVYTLAVTGYEPGPSQSVTIILPGLLNLRYDPNVGPRGTLIISWNTSGITYDQVQGIIAVANQDEVVLCKVSGDVVAIEQNPVGVEPIRLDPTTPPGGYVIEVGLRFLLDGTIVNETEQHLPILVPGDDTGS